MYIYRIFVYRLTRNKWFSRLNVIVGFIWVVQFTSPLRFCEMIVSFAIVFLYVLMEKKYYNHGFPTNKLYE